MNLFSLNYHYKLIELFIKATFHGVLVANIITPLISAYLLYPHIPISFIFVGLLLHLSIFLIRIFIGNKLLKILNKKIDLTAKYIKVIYLSVLVSALLNGAMLWVGILYDIPVITLVLLMTIVFALSTGSLITLSSLFSIYLTFIIVNMSMLISSIIYYGGELSHIFPLIFVIFLVVLIISGHRQYLILRNVIVLEDNFHEIYENSSDGIMIIHDNRFDSCNMSIVKMFGLKTKNELLVTKLNRFSPKYQPDGKLSLIKMAKMTQITLKNGVHSFEWLHTKLNGEEFWCEVVLTKINLKGKNFVHGVWRDISQRKEMQTLEVKYKKELELRVAKEVSNNMVKDRQLLHQSRLAQMGELIGMIAHQWRQPLSAIATTNSSLALKSQLGTLDDESLVRLTDSIDEYTKHLSTTIDDFRNFFKTNNEKNYTDYNQLLKSVLGIIKDTLDSSGVELRVDMQCEDQFYAFANELKQVILNLIKNADDILIDNKIENPYISVKSYLEGECCILEVSDNGGGIDDEIIDKIFNPYFSTKTKKDGTGMGLYMSKIIVEEHCLGKLSVENSSSGAIFKISIKKNKG